MGERRSGSEVGGAKIERFIVDEPHVLEVAAMLENLLWRAPRVGPRFVVFVDPVAPPAPRGGIVDRVMVAGMSFAPGQPRPLREIADPAFRVQALPHVERKPTCDRRGDRDPPVTIIDDVLDERAMTPEQREALRRWFTESVKGRIGFAQGPRHAEDLVTRWQRRARRMS